MKTLRLFFGIMAIAMICFVSCGKDNSPITANNNEAVVNNVVYKLQSDVSVDHNAEGPRYYVSGIELVEEGNPRFIIAGDFERYSVGKTIDLSSFASDDGYSFSITTPITNIIQNSYQEQRWAAVNDEYSETAAFKSGTKMVLTYEGEDNPFVMTIDGELVTGETVSIKLYVPANEIEHMYYDE